VSAKIPVWSWRQAVAKAKVPTLTKALCWAIANYLSDAGKGAWPSIDKLVSDTGMSPRSISRHLAAARKAKLLTATRPRLSNGTLGAYTKFHPKFPPNMVLVSDISADEGGIDAPDATTACGGQPDATQSNPDANLASLKNISKARSAHLKKEAIRVRVPAAPVDHEAQAQVFAAKMLDLVKPEPRDIEQTRFFFLWQYATEFGGPMPKMPQESAFFREVGRIEGVIARLQSALAKQIDAGNAETADRICAVVDRLEDRLDRMCERGREGKFKPVGVQ